MEYMEQQMDDLITSGIALESEMSDIVENVEKALQAPHATWGTIDPRKLVYTVLQHAAQQPHKCHCEKPTAISKFVCGVCGGDTHE